MRRSTPFRSVTEPLTDGEAVPGRWYAAFDAVPAWLAALCCACFEAYRLSEDGDGSRELNTCSNCLKKLTGSSDSHNQ